MWNCWVCIPYAYSSFFVSLKKDHLQLKNYTSSGRQLFVGYPSCQDFSLISKALSRSHNLGVATFGKAKLICITTQGDGKQYETRMSLKRLVALLWQRLHHKLWCTTLPQTKSLYRDNYAWICWLHTTWTRFAYKPVMPPVLMQINWAKRWLGPWENLL